MSLEEGSEGWGSAGFWDGVGEGSGRDWTGAGIGDSWAGVRQSDKHRDKTKKEFNLDILGQILDLRLG